MGLMLKAVYSFFIFRLSSYHLMLCFPPIWKPSLIKCYQILPFICLCLAIEIACRRVSLSDHSKRLDHGVWTIHGFGALFTFE